MFKKFVLLSSALFSLQGFSAWQPVCSFALLDFRGYVIDVFNRTSYNLERACTDAQYECKRFQAYYESNGYRYTICERVQYLPPRGPMDPRDPRWPRDHDRFPDPREREPRWPDQRERGPRWPDPREREPRWPDQRDREPRWPDQRDRYPRDGRIDDNGRDDIRRDDVIRPSPIDRSPSSEREDHHPQRNPPGPGDRRPRN